MDGVGLDPTGQWATPGTVATGNAPANIMVASAVIIERQEQEQEVQ